MRVRQKQGKNKKWQLTGRDFLYPSFVSAVSVFFFFSVNSVWFAVIRHILVRFCGFRTPPYVPLSKMVDNYYIGEVGKVWPPARLIRGKYYIYFKNIYLPVVTLELFIYPCHSFLEFNLLIPLLAIRAPCLCVFSWDVQIEYYIRVWETTVRVLTPFHIKTLKEEDSKMFWMELLNKQSKLLHLNKIILKFHLTMLYKVNSFLFSALMK